MTDNVAFNSPLQSTPPSPPPPFLSSERGESPLTVQSGTVQIHGNHQAIVNLGIKGNEGATIPSDFPKGFMKGIPFNDSKGTGLKFSLGDGSSQSPTLDKMIETQNQMLNTMFQEIVEEAKQDQA